MENQDQEAKEGSLLNRYAAFNVLAVGSAVATLGGIGSLVYEPSIVKIGFSATAVSLYAVFRHFASETAEQLYDEKLRSSQVVLPVWQDGKDNQNNHPDL